MSGRVISNVVLWGSGQIYSEYGNLVREYCGNHNILILGLTTKDNYYEYIDGIKIYNREELLDIDYDVIIAMVSYKNYSDVCLEAENTGLDSDRIIPVQVFKCDGFSIERYLDLRDSRISIFSNNCWGGYTYHYFGLKFLSPTINLSIGPEDKYLDMLFSLDEYMKEELIYSTNEINPVNNKSYPVAYIGDKVRVNLLHYSSFEEGYLAWKKRIERINYDNLFFMMYTENINYAKRFEQLSVKKKVCFVPFESDLPSAITVYPYIYRKNKNAPFWQFINDMASGKIVLYDVWDLLLYGNIVYRVMNL